MERTDANQTGGSRKDALVEALVAPRDSSFVDALLALADNAAEGDGSNMLSGGLQAALARKMRAAIAHENGSRDAA